MRRDAEVQQASINPLDAQAVQRFAQLCEAAPHGHEGVPGAGQQPPGVRDGFGVLIQPDDARPGRQQLGRMAASAKRPVHDHFSGRGRQAAQRLSHEHGLVIFVGPDFHCGFFFAGALHG